MMQQWKYVRAAAFKILRYYKFIDIKLRALRKRTDVACKEKQTVSRYCINVESS